MKTLCDSNGVCRGVGCETCPDRCVDDGKPKTTLVRGVGWIQHEPPKEPKASGWRKRAIKEKPVDHTLDYFKEAHDFIAPLIKDKGTTQIVRLYRDADGTIVGSEEVELVNQAVIGGANKYMGTYASLFNEGFRAAERIYGIGVRKKRTK